MKILAPHGNTPPPRLQRVLFVLHQGLHKKVAIKNWMQLRHSQVYMRANPRSYDYMLARAQEFVTQLAPKCRADLLASPFAGEELDPQTTDWLENLWYAPAQQTNKWPRNLRENLGSGLYDAVIFLYPDATGLGWRPVEKALAAQNAPLYLVINGRRRVFFWEPGSRFALAWRRGLARGWPLEMLFGLGVLGAGAVLAAYDGLTGKNKGLV